MNSSSFVKGKALLLQIDKDVPKKLECVSAYTELVEASTPHF